VSRIVYLSSARLPTEKAHGFQVMKMCEGLASVGHDVELIHPHRLQTDPALAAADPFEYYGVRPAFRLRTISNWDVVPLERRMPRAAFRALYAAHQVSWGAHGARRASQRKPDLIFTRDASFAYWASRLGRACAYEAHLPPTSRSARLVRGFSRRAATRAVFALTSQTAADLRAVGVPGSKVSVLPDAADLDAFAAAPARDEARRLLGLPARRPIIGYVGRFTTLGMEKGVGDLVRAVADPELRRLDPLLLCVGGPMDPVRGYEELGESLGVPSSAMRFVDRVPNPEVPTWMAALDVAVMPAPATGGNGGPDGLAAGHYEGATSPLKLFEYMAAGLPIVAPDLPGVRDVLGDGENGLLVTPRDPGRLAGALTRVLRDAGAARALAEGARRSAGQHTWERRAERVTEAALGAGR
jgi:glycosyltransferase involved in cell wall biosynthesis